MEGQETSDLDPHQGKLQNIWTYAHIPMYAGLRVISPYIREKWIKSHVQQIIGVFRDDLRNIKGTKIVHGVQDYIEGHGRP